MYSRSFSIKLLMLLVFSGWILVWILRPTPSFMAFFKSRKTTKAYGAAGWYIVFYSAPVIFLAAVASINLHLDRKTIKWRGKARRLNLWTLPVVVRGPLAVVSAAEAILFLSFIGLHIWNLYSYLSDRFSKITPAALQKRGLSHYWERRLQISGTDLGMLAMIPLALLFFPVARGSALLRVLNIPFEHAVKYHIWIGHTMMVVSTAHGLLYVLFWGSTGRMTELFQWSRSDISGLSGLLTWLAGGAMWITSLGPIRKRNFELFYYTHHLYIVFVLGYALHVGDRLYNAVSAGIILFSLDRCLRFLQSRNRSDVLSARMVSEETMEFTIAKLPSVEYHPASFVMVNFCEFLPMQWHPFTMVSSSKVEKEHLTLLIRCNGNWSRQLKGLLASRSSESRVDVRVEGPYGHDSGYMLRYDVLVFVAGGSGVSPFISLLKEFLYQVQNEGAPAPKHVILLWAVKRADELSVLQMLSPASEFSENLHLEVQVYVTREQGIDMENMGEPPPNPEFLYRCTRVKTRSLVRSEGIHNNAMHSVLIAASFLGFVSLVGVLGRCIVYPVDGNTGEVFPRSLDGFFAFISSIAGVVLFGGGALAIALKLTKLDGLNSELNPEKTLSSTFSRMNPSGVQPSAIHFGGRPEFQDIFSGFSKRFCGSMVGVFACGPVGMQQTSAAQCQTFRFHFHSLSFEL